MVSQEIKRFFCFLIISIILFTCSKTDIKQEPEKILAIVADKTISEDEFIYRSEFTVRPQYHGLDEETEKNIILNNLIVEKIFAIVAGDDNELSKNKIFQAYIRGIKEQYMREQLYYNEAHHKVQLDSTAILQAYQLASREYELEYFSFRSDTLASKIERLFNETKDSAAILFDQLTENKKTGKRKVAWNDQEIDVIHDALYLRPLKIGDIIGPVEVEKSKYLIAKVIAGNEYPVITTEDRKKRWDDVVQKLKRKKANVIWNEFIRKIMKGKEVKFERELFLKLSDRFYSLNLVADNNQYKLNFENFWQDKAEINTHEYLDIKKTLLDKPFFRLNDTVWTVRDFQEALMSHPLVFRKKNISKREFPHQFKLAIVDMLTDYYLTRAAYDKNLDKLKSVQRKTGMWQDALCARYQREQYMKTIKESDNEQTLYSLFNYSDSLLNVFKDRVYVNHEMLSMIQLTDINLIVFQQNVPFPAAVPGYPQLTNKSELAFQLIDSDE